MSYYSLHPFFWTLAFLKFQNSNCHVKLKKLGPNSLGYLISHLKWPPYSPWLYEISIIYMHIYAHCIYISYELHPDLIGGFGVRGLNNF